MDLILTTSQKLALSQRMLQSAEILQMSAQELVEYMKELSIENPLVEYEEKKQELKDFDLVKRKLEWLDAADEQNKTYYHEDKEDENSNDMWNFKENSGESLEEYLCSQLYVLPLNKEKLKIGHYIIECIDGNGYLGETTENIAKCLHQKQKEVEEILRVIQGFEPVGVGARNLRECLKIQMKKKQIKNPTAEKIIDEELETLGKNQLHIIAKRLKVSIEEVIRAKEVIRSLNPKPGNSFTSSKNLEYITPDVLIVKEEDDFKIIMNDNYFPQIKINGYYKTIMNTESSAQAKEYVCDKMKQAEWAMKCISKRNSTLMRTLQIIVEIQRDFFEKGPGNLCPMKLCDVAEKIQMHESTVSRAVRDKYLQCCWGIFPLNYFFSVGVSAVNEEGCGQQVTPECIKNQIKEIIDTEDKKCPYSDRAITEILNGKGIAISRRTVAKYREALGILGTTGRKGY